MVTKINSPLGHFSEQPSFFANLVCEVRPLNCITAVEPVGLRCHRFLALSPKAEDLHSVQDLTRALSGLFLSGGK
jgi:hypothetical protein